MNAVNETHMQFPTELTTASAFDVDPLVDTQANKIEGFFDRPANQMTIQIVGLLTGENLIYNTRYACWSNSQAIKCVQV